MIYSNKMDAAHGKKAILNRKVLTNQSTIEDDIL